MSRAIMFYIYLLADKFLSAAIFSCRKRKPVYIRISCYATIATATMSFTSPNVHAFSYLPPPFEAGPGIVVHPAGYTGQGGTLDVTLGIEPTSTSAANIIPALNNAIATWNNLTAVENNVLLAPDSNLPTDTFDFESVLLHEIGHSLGLSHPNLAPESGIDNIGLNFTSAQTGPNGIFDLNLGPDGIEGSFDDIRGDDVNRNFFPINSNNPFDSLSIIDSSTYSLNLSNLPAGHNFSANPDRHVAGSLGLTDTSSITNEAVMQQGVYPGESQRQLSYDDVAGIRYAQAGLDEIQGTTDDYTINLLFAGFTNNADIIIDFDNSFDYAGMSFSTYRNNANHRRMFSSTIMFNDTINWHFNDSATCITGDINCDGKVSLLDLDLISFNFGQTPATRQQGDLDGNNIVGLTDLDLMGQSFGNNISTIPEPATVYFTILGVAILLQRK